MSIPVLFICAADEEQPRCLDVLKAIFAKTGIPVEWHLPLPEIADYQALVAGDRVAALILDERLTTQSGARLGVAEIAAQLRTAGARVPIVILTNQLEDRSRDRARDSNCIFFRMSGLRDTSSLDALEFKAQVLRSIEIAGALRAVKDMRHHDLLMKNAEGVLTSDEQRQLSAFESAGVESRVASSSIDDMK